MDYKKLVESLEKMLPPKIPYGELVGAPWPYTGQGKMVYEDPESYFIEQAITAINDLLARAESAEARAEKAERERDYAIKQLKIAALERMEDFKEKYPHAMMETDGTPTICCIDLGYRKEDCDPIKESCVDCWNMPVEDE